MKNKSKQIIKPNHNSQSNTILIEKIEKKNQLKKWVNSVNPSNSQPGSWDGDNPIKSKFNVEGSWLRSWDWYITS
jgi:hypothetical protein